MREIPCDTCGAMVIKSPSKVRRSNYCSRQCAWDSQRQSPEKRFWKKVARTKAVGCWEWTAWRNAKGYGKFHFRDTSWAAHRASYVMAFGDIPEDIQVLHYCDNPSCVRPSHLFLGNNRDNRADCVSKGRNWKRLSVSDVRMIMDSNEGPTHLGRRLGVDRRSILAVRRGETWGHVTGVQHGS